MKKASHALRTIKPVRLTASQVRKFQREEQMATRLTIGLICAIILFIILQHMSA